MLLLFFINLPVATTNNVIIDDFVTLKVYYSLS
jgi:hypothetical protein